MIVISASSQILSSSDLNCNFNNVCQWRNATNGEQDDGDFVVSNHLVFDLQRITAKDNDIGDLKFCSIKSTINYEQFKLLQFDHTKKKKSKFNSYF